MSGHNRVLVAGAAGGIGSACVRRLVTDGHAVLGVDRGVAPDADTRVHGEPAADGRPDAHANPGPSARGSGEDVSAARLGDLAPGQVAPEHEAVDITLPGGAEHAVDAAIGRLGGLSGVVHAIGMSGRSLGDGPVSVAGDEAWAEVLRINLESAFRLLRAALPVIEPGGSVVVVGSVLAHHTDPDFVTAAYAASKSGLEGLVRVAAREAADRDVRVNCVTAGLVDTPMAGRALSDPAITGRLKELQPLGGRAVSADEVAGVVSWLLSADAAAVTGSCIPADRGWTLR